MSVRVIIPPEPIVTPGDIPGAHPADDATVARAIAAATRTVDGPSGWLGRALGPQMLELAGWFGCERIRLPYPPLIRIVDVVAEDRAGNVETADPSTWRQGDSRLIVKAGAAWVARPIHRIRYEAGYDGVAVEDGGTGPVPPEAIEAIILLVQDRLRTGALDAGIRSETVEGVGSTAYLDSDRFSDLAQRAARNHLSGLRIWT